MTGLSRPTSNAGKLQRACLELLHEHEAADTLPTSGRFLWYELVTRGTVDKTKARGHPGVRYGVDQAVSQALTQLREQGVIPWTWIVDETRTLQEWESAPTVADFAAAAVRQARLDPWVGRPPLLLVESRSLAGVLREVAATYVVPLAATNGQVGGFLHTDIAPALVDGQRVLYLGDHDWQGHQIEANTRRVLATYAELGWERVALLPEHVTRYQLPTVPKLDRRYRPPRTHDAVETEALSQAVIVGMVRNRLDALLPEPLERIHVREQAERQTVAAILANGG